MLPGLELGVGSLAWSAQPGVGAGLAAFARVGLFLAPVRSDHRIHRAPGVALVGEHELTRRPARRPHESPKIRAAVRSTDCCRGHGPRDPQGSHRLGWR